MSLVVLVIGGAFVGLFDIVCRNDAKEQRHAGAQSRFADTARRRRGDVIKVRGVASNYDTETNHGVESTGLSRLLRGQRNLKRSRNAKQLDGVGFTMKPR